MALNRFFRLIAATCALLIALPASANSTPASPTDETAQAEGQPVVVEFAIYRAKHPVDTIDEKERIGLGTFLPITANQLVYYPSWQKQLQARVIEKRDLSSVEQQFTATTNLNQNVWSWSSAPLPPVLSADTTITTTLPRQSNADWQLVCYSQWPMNLVDHKKQTVNLISEQSCHEQPEDLTFTANLTFLLRQYIDIDGRLLIWPGTDASSHPDFANSDYLNFSRRVKFGQWNYLDHPRYGVLVTIRKQVPLDDANQTNNTHA